MQAAECTVRFRWILYIRRAGPGTGGAQQRHRTFSTGTSASADPEGIAAGPDGHLWFTEADLPGIGRLTPDGAVTPFTAGVRDGVVAGAGRGRPIRPGSREDR
jgi:streptogramin lyase